MVEVKKRASHQKVTAVGRRTEQQLELIHFHILYTLVKEHHPLLGNIEHKYGCSS